MPRKPKFQVDAEVKNELLGILFGADKFSVEIAEKILSKNWAESLFDWFDNQVEKPVVEEKPTKNSEYKKMYEKLAKQVKSNFIVVDKFENPEKYKDETPEETK